MKMHEELENYTLSKRYTREELQIIKALCDTAVRFNFGGDIILGVDNFLCAVSIFKSKENVWVVLKHDDKKQNYYIEKFYKCRNACISVIKECIKNDNVDIVVDYFNLLLYKPVTESKLIDFANERGYTYASNKIRKLIKK